MAADNPLRLIHNALWTLLEANATITTEVKPGNRIKYITTKREPEKRDATSDDYTELKVVPVSSLPKLSASSSTDDWDVTWQIRVATAEQPLQTVLDIQWEIFQALAKWKATMDTLTYNGKGFIKKAMAKRTTMTLDDSNENRAIRGWTAVWTGETELFFTLSDLR